MKKPKKRFLFVGQVDMAIDGNKAKAEQMIADGLKSEGVLLAKMRGVANMTVEESDQLNWDLKVARKQIKAGQRILNTKIPRLAAKRAEIQTQPMAFLPDESVQR